MHGTNRSVLRMCKAQSKLIVGNMQSPKFSKTLKRERERKKLPTDKETLVCLHNKQSVS